MWLYYQKFLHSLQAIYSSLNEDLLWKIKFAVTVTYYDRRYKNSAKFQSISRVEVIDIFSNAPCYNHVSSDNILCTLINGLNPILQ